MFNDFFLIRTIITLKKMFFNSNILQINKPILNYKICFIINYKNTKYETQITLTHLYTKRVKKKKIIFHNSKLNFGLKPNNYFIKKIHICAQLKLIIIYKTIYRKKYKSISIK